MFALYIIEKLFQSVYHTTYYKTNSFYMLTRCELLLLLTLHYNIYSEPWMCSSYAVPQIQASSCRVYTVETHAQSQRIYVSFMVFKLTLS
jgi:hypothetical protein